MSKTITIFIALAGLFLQPIISKAQQAVTTKSKKAIEAYNEGLKYFSLNRYTDAAASLNQAIEADNRFIEAYLVLAEVYEDAGYPLKAIEVYRKGLALDEKFYPYGFIRQANLQYNEGLYEDALKAYEHFISLNTGNPGHIARANDGIDRCRFSIHAVNNPVDFHPESLGPGVNTTDDEYWPSLSADEKTLVVTRLVPGSDILNKIQEDFFISVWEGNNWSSMDNMGSPLNTPNNEGAQTLSGDGRLMVFTACNRSDGVGRCDLYTANRIGDNWSVPVNLGKPVNSAYRETQPSITPDGRTLYFSSDRPGGKGLHDIYVTRLNEKGEWSVPENLGELINTPGTEMSPFVHPDNQSLYFSSDGLIGLGGYDLFVSRRDSAGEWQKPVNLGYPINTHRDEMGLIVNARGNKAYYASDVEAINGKDIFVFDLPLETRPVMTTYMKGKVFDVRDHRLLRAEFELTDLETGQVSYRSFSDSVTGEFLVSIPVNRNYMLNVSRSGYLFFSENVALKNIFNADSPFLKDVPLYPLMAGNSIVLRNVFFETDSYALKSESRIELDKVVKLLQANPGIHIEIGGHTDNTGTEAHNQALSENRAKAVTDYLVSASINPSRIRYKGYGWSVPVAGNETPEGRAQNRRTELKVVE
ncbi:MAG: PD40 domain-containing protein [Bacteroidales bacterium]|nr:PD40 domain-containing protein [Bacteroidales bacterium]